MMKKQKNLMIMAGLCILLIGGFMIIMKSNSRNGSEEIKGQAQKLTSEGQQNEAGDLVIPLAEVSETAVFYEAVVDGTELEVIAVKASDGTVRTAFNTCQVCYSSGRGYYEQQGDALICQNCGNAFMTSEVELSRGGCNPVPIMEEHKITDADTITISEQYLAEAKDIFANWRR